MIDCPEAQDAAVAYATSGLDACGMRELLEHLAACPECCRFLHSVTETLQLLPYGLPPVEPPARLRHRVLRAIHRENRAAGPRLSRELSRRPWFRGLVAGAACAAAVAVLAHGGLTWRAWSETRSLAADLAEARSQLQAAATLLGEVDATPVQRLALAKGPAFPDSWGHVTVYRTGYGYVFVVAAGGLPPLAPGEVYEVWLTEGGRRWSCGRLQPDAAGFATLIRQERDFSYDTIGITRETTAQPEGMAGGPRVLFGKL